APGDHVLASFSARREEVYAEVYAVEGGGRTVESGGWSVEDGGSLAGPEAVPLAELGEWLPEVDGTMWIAGDGAEAVLQALDALHDKRRTTHYKPSPALPTATAVGILGREVFSTRGPADVASFEPFYLKEFVAKKPKRTIFDRLPF
ncbi:MAG TPA: hypothetical protein VF183_05365, partial [Acidimicrobiales bacterium]